MKKLDELLLELGISKVRLAKYLGVSRQMVYNYLDSTDLSKLPNEKCQLLFELLNVKSADEILALEINKEYLQTVGSRIFDSAKEEEKKEKTCIDLTGLNKEEIELINDITLMS